MIEFEDVMFDEDPLELADELCALEKPVDIIIMSDEEPEADSCIYFGIPAEIGEIIEVKGIVNKIEETDDELYRISVSVMEVDSDLKNLAVQELTSQTKKNSESEPVWALGLKQQNNTYAVLANTPGGILTAEQVAKVAELAENGAGTVKLTHAQRVIILVKADQVETAKETLNSVGLKVGILHKGIRNIRACSGSLCRFAQQTNGLDIASDVEERLFGRYTAFNVKIAISDCMRNCSESYCSDIGFIGEKGRYTVLVGGRGSMVPHRALILMKGLEPAKVSDVAEEIVDWYVSRAEKGERLNKLLQRLGSGIEVDLSALQTVQNNYGDEIDEVERLKEHFERLAGLEIMRAEMSFCH